MSLIFSSVIGFRGRVEPEATEVLGMMTADEG
jgi:hypothetical protein